MAYLEHTKNFNTFMEVLLRDPERYRPIVELRDIMTQHFDELSWAECELIGAEISEQNGSEFCTGVRRGIANALGGDESILGQKKYQSLIRFSKKLNHNPGSITEADIQQIRDSGWSDQTIEDIIGLVAMTNVYNILAKGMGFAGVAESVFFKMGQATVAKRSYTALYQSFLEGAKGGSHAKTTV